MRDLEIFREMSDDFRLAAVDLSDQLHNHVSSEADRVIRAVQEMDLKCTKTHYEYPIFKHLEFGAMTTRQRDIESACEGTFDWIWKPDLGGSSKKFKPGHDFKQWLETDSSLYWIKGKAGSGKSTVILPLSLMDL